MPTGRTRISSWTARLWTLLAGIAPLSASQADTARVVDFSSPDAVENQISEDAQTVPAFVKERALQPWFDWKDEVKADTGISFGLDYTGLYLGRLSSSDSGDDIGTGADSASSGIVRFFGAWELFGRGSPNNGALVWKVENRHAYGKVAPGAFGLAELGYVGLIDGPWNDDGTRLTNLYWRQRLLDGRATVTSGYLYATDYIDAFGGGSPWTGFESVR